RSGVRDAGADVVNPPRLGPQPVQAAEDVRPRFGPPRQHEPCAPGLVGDGLGDHQAEATSSAGDEVDTAVPPEPTLRFWDRRYLRPPLDGAPTIVGVADQLVGRPPALGTQELHQRCRTCPLADLDELDADPRMFPV